MPLAVCSICCDVLDSTFTTDLRSQKAEKPAKYTSLDCCKRNICTSCLNRHPQYQRYCPYCQDVRLPGESSSSQSTNQATTFQTDEESLPPPYSEHDPELLPSNVNGSSNSHISGPPPPTYQQAPGAEQPKTDAVHYVRPNDTFALLSLAYNLPAVTLKAHNRISTDLLLQARQTIKIPRPPYRGESLSAEPVEGFEEHQWKLNVRRFMKVCKCVDRKMAETYMQNADGNLDNAVVQWTEDERWIEQNPVGGKKNFGAWLLQSRERGLG